MVDGGTRRRLDQQGPTVGVTEERVMSDPAFMRGVKEFHWLCFFEHSLSSSKTVSSEHELVTGGIQ
jgi:hypothetical protein